LDRDIWLLSVHRLLVSVGMSYCSILLIVPDDTLEGWRLFAAKCCHVNCRSRPDWIDLAAAGCEFSPSAFAGFSQNLLCECWVVWPSMSGGTWWSCCHGGWGGPTVERVWFDSVMRAGPLTRWSKGETAFSAGSRGPSGGGLNGSSGARPPPGGGGNGSGPSARACCRIFR